METIKGYKVKGRKGIDHWDSLMEEWLLLNERYCRIMGEDAAFLYNERALIGTVAGAAWRCGRISLEEFQCEKGFSNKKKSNGRADLYIASEFHEEQIEAKYKWVSLNSNDISQACSSVLDKALTDAKKTKGSTKSLEAIGVAFIPVYLPLKQNLKLEEFIESAIKELSSNPRYHLVAWFFPKQFRSYVSANNNILPGVFMLASNTKYA